MVNCYLCDSTATATCMKCGKHICNLHSHMGTICVPCYQNIKKRSYKLIVLMLIITVPMIIFIALMPFLLTR